jgi:aryl-alcohol dehydrogenase-like predicted oxidoreductase
VTKHIRIGERDIPRMGMGTNRLTQTPDNVHFLRGAAELGIGLVDTAHLYTGGSSESTVGEAFGALAERPVIATKGGFRPGEGRPDVLSSQIEESLSRLRVDRIDLYYLHRVDPETPLEDSVGTIALYRERGAIAEIGLSEVGVEEIERARTIAPIAAVQNHYNLDERRWDDAVDYCEREGIVFVPFYPLHASSIAAQLALAWLLRRSTAILPIPGTLSLAHVRENVRALDIELSDETYKQLSAGAQSRK